MSNMNVNEVDKLIETVGSKVREAYELLREASVLSENINFDELKKIVDIEKYNETINYIAQDLSFMKIDPIKRLNVLYNVKYWDVLNKL